MFSDFESVGCWFFPLLFMLVKLVLPYFRECLDIKCWFARLFWQVLFCTPVTVECWFTCFFIVECQFARVAWRYFYFSMKAICSAEYFFYFWWEFTRHSIMEIDKSRQNLWLTRPSGRSRLKRSAGRMRARNSLLEAFESYRSWY